jgi:hypothetical protein
MDKLGALMMEILLEVKAIAEQFRTPSDSNSDIWMDNVEVQEYLHVSSKTLQRLRDAGLLQYSKIRGKIFYRRSDIHKMLEQNRITTSSKIK